MKPDFPLDPDLDLVLERVLKAPRSLVWRCWTQAEHLRNWFAPHPVVIEECSVDLRVGGGLSTVMKLPDGTRMPTSGCFLEIVPEQRLVTTDTLLPGFRPAPQPFFSAIMTFEDHPEGCLYTARAIHGNPETRKQHEEMGFHDGWGTVAGQLETYARSLMS